MKIINAGVTAPKGFKCAGLRAGVKTREDKQGYGNDRK